MYYHHVYETKSILHMYIYGICRFRFIVTQTLPTCVSRFPIQIPEHVVLSRSAEVPDNYNRNAKKFKYAYNISHLNY